MSTSAPFQHAEAFCVMTYQCEKCKRRELLWNSRDGVTPFLISCGKWEGAHGNCDGSMAHADWQNDIRAPAFGDLLKHGHAKKETRIFVDANDPRARTRLLRDATRFVKEWWDKPMATGGAAMRHTLRKDSGAEMTKGEAIHFFLKEWSKPGQPAIITSREYLDYVAA